MKQQTGSKSGKEYIKVVYCHLAYLTSMHTEYLRAKISEIEAAADYDMGLSDSIPSTPTVTINDT